ncbi:MAG: hypothetical protein KDA84_10730 [Planctomycetaceae bacterium]|nr:hypothetical protein [Planctomycetaceae bacterium]
MKSLAICCPLCGSDNIFPTKYAGRTLSCSHCGESLPVKSGKADPVLAKAEPAPTSRDSAPRETGLRRLNRAICHGVCLLCFLVVGVIGGGWGGVELAQHSAHLNGLVALATCPIGAILGFFLSRWIGQGVGRLMSSYRLTFPATLLGMTGGLVFWGLSAESPYSRLTAGTLAWDEWIAISLFVAVGGIVTGLFGMIFDAFVGFTD